MTKQCGHISLNNGKAFKCIERWGVEHSHQDHSPEQRVKRGEAKVVPVMPLMIIEELSDFLEVNEGISKSEVKDWLPYVRAAKKNGVKS